MSWRAVGGTNDPSLAILHTLRHSSSKQLLECGIPSFSVGLQAAQQPPSATFGGRHGGGASRCGVHPTSQCVDVLLHQCCAPAELA